MAERMATPETTNSHLAPEAQPSLRWVLTVVAANGCVGAAVAFVLGGPRSALGVATGAGLAFSNLWAFGRLGSALLSTAGSKGPWIALALGKVAVLFAVVICLLSCSVVGPIQLALGYLAMPVGIALSFVVFRDPRLDRNRESA
jgi:hypothetical protein